MKKSPGWNNKETFGSSIDYGGLLKDDTTLVVLCEITN